jgi:hypothetical protein
MRLLGPKSTLSTFRWDLVYLYGGINAAENAPAIKALAPTVLGFITKLKTERSDLEDTENAWMVALALRTRRDNQVDTTTVELGGVARATDKETYAVLFPTFNPSQITKLSLAEQLQENHRIQKELEALPTDHDLRQEYGAELLEEIEALENADKAVDQADVALALARSKVRQLKLQLDKDRLGIHAQLVGILGDKKAADTYFRPAATEPGTKDAGTPGDAANAPPP